MLEKSRLVRRPEGEPSFHVFYQMLAGIDSALRFDTASPVWITSAGLAIISSGLAYLFRCDLLQSRDVAASLYFRSAFSDELEFSKNTFYMHYCAGLLNKNLMEKLMRYLKIKKCSKL